MILLTGDTHGALCPFLRRLIPYQPRARDTVIVCGDFGFVWNTPAQLQALARLSELPFTVAFIDGNHEDFDLLGTYPQEEWNGGTVRRIAGNTVHLMRGQHYEIEGCRIFTMGGGYSRDKALRTEHLSWWREELPCRAEYETALAALSRIGYETDLILTHTLPRSAVPLLGLHPDPHEAALSAFLERMYRRMRFRMWYAGHFHVNRLLREDLAVLHDAVAVVRAGTAI